MDLDQEIIEAVDKLDIANDDIARSQLPVLIKKIYDLYKSNLSDWQKVKIADAIAAYRIGWFYLSRFSLFLALEDPKNISKEPRHVKRLKEAAHKIDIQKLLDEINSLT